MEVKTGLAPGRRRSLGQRCGVVASSLADQLAKLIVASSHVRVVLHDVLPRQAKEFLVVCATKLMATGALDDPTHLNLPSQGNNQV